MALDSTLCVVGRLISDSVKIGGTAVGHVSGGVNLTKEVTQIDLFSDYSVTKIGTEQTEVKYIVDLSLAEFKVGSLQYALGLAAANIWGTSAGIIDDAKPASTTLEFIVYGGSTNPHMIFYFYKTDFNAGGRGEGDFRFLRETGVSGRETGAGKRETGASDWRIERASIIAGFRRADWAVTAPSIWVSG